MGAFTIRGLTARSTGLGLMVSLLALSGCTPSAPQLSSSGPAAASQSAPTGTGPVSPSISTPPTGPGPESSSAPAPVPDTGPVTSSTSAPPPDSGGMPGPPTGDRVISSTVSHEWAWPGPTAPFKSTHNNPVPLGPPPAEPLPTLDSIGIDEHPSETPSYDQLSFRFNGAFPSYEISFVPALLADGSGLPIPMPGTGAILKVTFRGAQAHTSDGKPSIPTGSPTPSAGRRALTGYVPAGDFEGILSYGVGVGRSVTPPPTPAPQTKVRVYEVEKIEQGRHLFVVAVQLDASFWK